MYEGGGGGGDAHLIFAFDGQTPSIGRRTSDGGSFSYAQHIDMLMQSPSESQYSTGEHSE